MFFFFKQKTAYEMRISDWSSDVCSSDLPALGGQACVDHPFARPTVGEGVRQVVEPGSDLLVAVVGRRWAALGSLISELRGFVAASGFVLGELGLRRLRPIQARPPDRKRVVSGKSVSVRVDLGGRRIIKKKKTEHRYKYSATIHVT